MNRLVRETFNSDFALVDIIAAPLRGLLYSPISFLTFITASVVPLVILVLAAFESRLALIDLMPHGNITILGIVALSLLLLTLFASLPFAVLAISIPIKALWNNTDSSLTSLLHDFGTQSRRAMLGSALSIIGLITLAFALLATFCLGALAARQYGLTQYALPISISVSLLAIFTFRHIFFIQLILPIMLTVSNASPGEISTRAPLILAGQQITLLSLLALLFATPAAAYLLVVENVTFIEHPQALATIIAAGLAWYLLSVLAAFCLAASEQTASARMRVLREGAPRVSINSNTKSASVQERNDGSIRRPAASSNAPIANRISPKDLEIEL